MTSFPEATSRTRATPSSPAVASRCPSRLNVILVLSARFPKQIAATTFESLDGGQVGEFLAIIIDALDGNDTITAGPTVQKSVWIDAGAGDDRVVIRSGNAILVDRAEIAAPEGGQRGRNDSPQQAFALFDVDAGAAYQATAPGTSRWGRLPTLLLLTEPARSKPGFAPTGQATPAAHRRIFPPARILRRTIVFMFDAGVLIGGDGNDVLMGGADLAFIRSVGTDTLVTIVLGQQTLWPRKWDEPFVSEFLDASNSRTIFISSDRRVLTRTSSRPPTFRRSRA